jgi:hypothetical protein
MDFQYSPSQKGFYSPDIHPSIPEDAVVLKKGEHAKAMEKQAQGWSIQGVNADGTMKLVEPAPPSPEEIKQAKVALVQSHMDEQARTLGYDGISNAITYADEPAVEKFQNEGRAFRTWRSLVWEKCYAIFDDVQAGARQIPTDQELIAELPALQLPQVE